MALTQPISLATFDGRLMDGLQFCRKVYRFFDQIRRERGGIQKLRLRPTKREKRLVEELIPIARYVQARYNEGRRIRVRWHGGSQQYDAVLLSSGALIEHQMAPARTLVEVTMAMHRNNAWSREYLDEHGMSFGAKGISFDRKTKQVRSIPHVYTNDERANDFASEILDRLKEKGAKDYPSGTVLIVYCDADCLILPAEWNEAVERVASDEAHQRFREVFLFNPVGSHSATLFGRRDEGYPPPLVQKRERSALRKAMQ